MTALGESRRTYAVRENPTLRENCVMRLLRGLDGFESEHNLVESFQVLHAIKRSEMVGSKNGGQRCGTSFVQSGFESLQTPLRCLHVGQHPFEDKRVGDIARLPCCGYCFQEASIETFAQWFRHALDLLDKFAAPILSLSAL